MKEKELTEFCDDGCSKEYCFVRAILEIDQKYNKRLVMQMKMLEVFKYKLETASGQEVGWRESLVQWIEGGMAKKFGELFEEGASIREMKKRLFNEPSYKRG